MDGYWEFDHAPVNIRAIQFGLVDFILPSCSSSSSLSSFVGEVTNGEGKPMRTGK